MSLRDLRPYLLAILMTLPGLALRLALRTFPMLRPYWLRPGHPGRVLPADLGL